MPATLSLPTLPVANLQSATFECTYGRGCDGHCCKNGRPPVTPRDDENIRSVLGRALPLMRADARELVEADGFISRRQKVGHPMLRVSGGWCVFFNGGCVLHAIGAEDGEAYRYKPASCALFPLEPARRGEWYVRQWGYRGEEWDLHCLNPHASSRPAAESLADELALAERMCEPR